MQPAIESKPPEPYDPLTQDVVRRKRTRKPKKDDVIKVASIRIEKRAVVFEF